MIQAVITKEQCHHANRHGRLLHNHGSKLYAYGVDSAAAIEKLATTLRNIIGEIDLDGTLTSRELTRKCGASSTSDGPWGIKVNRVELKNILPPEYS